MKSWKILFRNSRPPKLEAIGGLLPTNTNTDFAVSIKDEGYAGRVCVEGVDNARWVVDRLSELFAFRTSEPMCEGARSTQCIFRVAYGSQLTHRRLTSLLSAMTGVRLKLIAHDGEV